MKKLALAAFLASSLLCSAASAAVAPPKPSPLQLVPDATPVPPGLKSLSRQELVYACVVSGMRVGQGAFTAMARAQSEEEGMYLMGLTLQHLLAGLVWFQDAPDMTADDMTRLGDAWDEKSVSASVDEATYCKDVGLEQFEHLDADNQAELREQVKELLLKFREEL